jgi:hypothetical protein
VTVDRGAGFSPWRRRSTRLIAGGAVDFREFPDYLVVYRRRAKRGMTNSVSATN